MSASADVLLAALFSILPAFSLPLSPAAGGADAAAPPQLVVTAPPELAGDAARVRRFDASRLAAIVPVVGLEQPGPPIHVFLLSDRSPVARSTPPWIAGFANGADDVIVLFPARSPSYPDDSLEEVLDHEVAHILIWRAADGRPVPRWFNEGLAMTVEHGWGLQDDTRLAFENIWSGEPTLAQVDRLFGQGQRGATRAYAVAGAFVRFLLARNEDAAAAILRRVAEGEPFDQAFREVTGLSLDAAQQAFWAERAAWKRWATFLTSSVALWMGITLLALYAIRKRRERRAALRRRWEEEGEPGPDDPDQDDANGPSPPSA